MFQVSSNKNWCGPR